MGKYILSVYRGKQKATRQISNPVVRPTERKWHPYILRRSPNSCSQNTVVIMQRRITHCDWLPRSVMTDRPNRERMYLHFKVHVCVYLKRYVQRIYLSPQRNNNTGKVVFCISNCWVKKKLKRKSCKWTETQSGSATQTESN